MSVQRACTSSPSRHPRLSFISRLQPFQLRFQLVQADRDVTLDPCRQVHLRLQVKLDSHHQSRGLQLSVLVSRALEQLACIQKETALVALSVRMMASLGWGMGTHRPAGPVPSKSGQHRPGTVRACGRHEPGHPSPSPRSTVNHTHFPVFVFLQRGKGEEGKRQDPNTSSSSLPAFQPSELLNPGN